MNTAGPSRCNEEAYAHEDEVPDEPFADSSSSYQPSEEDETDSDSSPNRKKPKTTKSVVKLHSLDQTITKKRNRKPKKELWKRTINKKLRLSGKRYINRNGKEVLDKKPKEINCTCRFKCSVKIADEQRCILCKEYYDLADYVRQKMYLASNIKTAPVARKRSSPKTKNRKTSRLYFLKDSSGIKQRVCLKFFCATFAISHRVIETCLQNISSTGLYTGYDKRKDTMPANATPLQAQRLVREHIDSYPTMESHYCRRDSTKKYLSPELNLSKMYRMYKNEFCREKSVEPVSKFVYEKIFHDYEPRLDFYIPKKDQCFQCNAYNNAMDKSTLQEEHDKHKRREKEAL